MDTLLHVASAVGIIVGLMAIVAGLLYGFCMAVLSLVAFFPVIGKKHRHRQWDELNKRSGNS